ncbi:CDP-diacylglycerol--serine O-phosphatidyltransferase [Hoeflea sp. WL0058]|uniref:CDP-diacylglycerol--serine O-phosphatidyltransferase n=1 Tax=Flavimaribacter sediminis TaxID=2865987 RepID=A0AAE2ZRM7_9HYPH|nr:CDP-diacylglycerol--serine O-phosphatidyltransferase [Flavimaribacter sediminis]MBW8639597.1 CDP-diacylglycerol--serine O-phosphatidyltransferase [Flavimaribacter sediminis]
MDTGFSPFDPHGPEKSSERSRGPRLRDISFRMMLPNVITTLAICAGLTGVRLAFEQRFELAVAMVLLAAFLDGVDGRVARLLKSTSKFGAQMDSLADIVNFGVAPALVLYVYLLDQVRSFGWIAALVYAIAAGLRLARFNVMAEQQSKAAWQSDYFIGIPAPGGALLALFPIYLGFLGVDPSPGFAYVASAYTMLIGFLMVSRLPVYSGKSLGQRIRRDLVFPLMLVIVLYVGLLLTYMWETMTVTTVLYLISLPFGARAWQKRYGLAARKQDVE